MPVGSRRCGLVSRRPTAPAPALPNARRNPRKHSLFNGYGPLERVSSTLLGGLDERSEERVGIPPLGRICQTNVYSVAGKLLKDTNLDKGNRWSFHDAVGALIRRWDDRTQTFRLVFDVLRRPTELFHKAGAGAETLLQKTVYGDNAGLATPQANNLSGQVIRLFDGAGRVKSESYDFKGNRLSSERRLAVAYTTTPSWSAIAGMTSMSAIDTAAASLLEAETFTESRTFDALGRLMSATAPDASVFWVQTSS